MTNKEVYPESALVVGGGIGGLATSIALRRSGTNVRLVERAPEFGEIGAGLQLGPNATRILDEWGLLERALEVGVSVKNLILRDTATGHELTRLALDSTFSARYGSPYLVIHRTDLHSILLNAAKDAGVELLTNTTVTAAEVHEDQVTATSTDGRTFTADVAYGADGLHSVLRQSIVGDAPVASGYVAYRGTVPIDDVPDEQGLEDVVVWVGPRHHLVQYRLRAGKMLNIVATIHSPSFEAGEDPEDNAAELAAAFEGAHPKVQRAIAHVGTQKRWPLFDRAPAQNWGEGRLVLVGDAAHPMLQYLAQGACQALEDAAQLERLTANSPEGSRDWDEVNRRFVAERQPRTAQVQNRARLFGEFCHADGMARMMRNALVQKIGDDLFSYTDWLYGSPIPDSGTELERTLVS
jgi:2-polyprenyl-6-methoxyphenol hydroxylase-like FAD-dependent oxidoreductase